MPVAAARQQRIEDAVLGALLGLGAHAQLGLLAVQLDRGVGQVAHDLLDVLADVADLGEARGLDLDERRVGQRRQAARDLGLADAGRADHQDVLGHHLVAQLRLRSCMRRQRLRSAMATARLAACWPTMWRSSSCTISRGVMVAEDVVDLVRHGCASVRSGSLRPRAVYGVAVRCGSAHAAPRGAARQRDVGSEFFDHDVAVGVDADVAGDVERLDGDRSARPVRCAPAARARPTARTGRRSRSR